MTVASTQRSIEGADSTVEAIRERALACFAAQGYHGTSLREIARDSGTTLGTLYHYFPSKEGLLLDLMKSAMEPLLESLERVEVVREPSPESQLFWLTKGFVEFAATNQRLAILADVELRALSPENLAIVVHWRDQYQNRLLDVVERGIDEGAFTCDDPKIAVFSIIAVGNQVAHWYEAKGRFSVEEVSTRVALVALRIAGQSPEGRAVMLTDLGLEPALTV